MRGSRFGFSACCVTALLLAGCGGSSAPSGEGEAAAAPATAQEAPGGEGGGAVNVPTSDPNRPFVRVQLDKVEWRATEGNTLGVQTAILEGDPSKPGFYLTVNRFPPGVMSRPHYHPDERNCIVLKGTWYTGEGDKFDPPTTVGLKAGDYMRHPKGGHHYDGALDEEVLVAISGYGPTSATVLDGGPLFGKSK
jgi:hypothetical protein